MKPTFVQQLERLKVIPIVTMEDARHAEPVAEALVRGGLPCAEVTFRTDAALEVITSMSRTGDLLVGAGTVLDVDQAEAAMDAGAQFIVTPGLHYAVVDYCIERNIPLSPGVATASEIAWAYDRGLRLVKFFPAETMGGAAGLKALCAPYRMMKFIPTGGINPSNVRSYLENPQVVACGGSWVAAGGLYESGDYGKVEQAAREAVSIAGEGNC